MSKRSPVLAFALLAGFASAPLGAATAAEPAKRFEALGHKIEVKLDRAATKGAYAVLELADPPGMGPPRHVHSAEDEIFYVIEGTIRVWRGSETFEAGPGAVAYMPRNVPHTYQNVGKTESRIVVVITPGRLQRFFEEASAGKLAAPKDNAAIGKLAGRYGIKVLGPPPGATAAR